LAAIVVWLRRREHGIVRRQLSAYGRAGWFAPHEVDMLVSLRRLRKAEKWAAQHGEVARRAMHDFILAAVELALDRHGVLHGKPTPRKIGRAPCSVNGLRTVAG